MDQSMEVRIGRYLAGEMTVPEMEVFEQELVHDPILKRAVSDYQRIWQLGDTTGAVPTWDVDAAWDRFSSVAQPSARKIAFKRSISFWTAAATILVVFGAYMFFFREVTPRHYVSAETAIEPIVLSDGSKIYLNKGADIAVHRFTRKLREVDLYGEAYFEIAPEPNRPFKVISGGTVTEVVGTSFNICQRSGKTSIYVNSGKVIFSTKEDQKQALALTAGEAAVFENQRMQMIPNPSPNVHAWRTHQLEFKNMPLAEVIRDVSLYFGQEIRIENEAITSCRISILRPFKKPEIESLLNAVAVSIHATLVKEGDTYILRGGNCS